MKSLGARIKKLREEKNLSVLVLAKEIGVSPSTLRDWEYGRQIKGEPYMKIASYFQVSLNFLLTGNELEIEDYLNEIEKHVTIIRSLL